MSDVPTPRSASPAACGAQRGHIAVFNVPMQGHVFPTLAVVEQLVARGWRVSYAVSEQFAEQVGAAGAQPVLYEDVAAGTEAPEDLAAGVSIAVRRNLSSLPALATAFSGDRPDLVLYDMYAWAGPLLAAFWNVPAVLLAPTHLPYRGIVRELLGVEDIDRIPGYEQLREALVAYGVTRSVHELTLAPERAVAFFPECFQRHRDQVTARDVTYVGPALNDRAHQGTWTPPESGRPVLLVALGSQYHHRPEFYRACARAFADTPWHVVMSVGDTIDLGDLGHLPPSIEVHSSVPQLAVLAHARAFVTHAGMGSTMEALAHGVPLVAVPQMAEQRANAQQIGQLSLGVCLPRDQATPEALRRAVDHVTSSADIAHGLAAMRRHIRDAGGAPAAADAVEHAAATLMATAR